MSRCEIDKLCHAIGIGYICRATELIFDGVDLNVPGKFKKKEALPLVHSLEWGAPDWDMKLLQTDGLYRVGYRINGQNNLMTQRLLENGADLKPEQFIDCLCLAMIEKNRQLFDLVMNIIIYKVGEARSIEILLSCISGSWWFSIADSRFIDCFDVYNIDVNANEIDDKLRGIKCNILHMLCKQGTFNGEEEKLRTLLKTYKRKNTVPLWGDVYEVYKPSRCFAPL